MVGYGTCSKGSYTPTCPKGMDYWIIKNSWGEEDVGPMRGYFLMERNKNVCGIAAEPVYPIR